MESDFCLMLSTFAPEKHKKNTPAHDHRNPPVGPRRIQWMTGFNHDWNTPLVESFKVEAMDRVHQLTTIK